MPRCLGSKARDAAAVSCPCSWYGVIRRFPYPEMPLQYQKNAVFKMPLLAGSQVFGAAIQCQPAAALPGFKKDLNKRRNKAKIPESEFKDGPQGLKYD